MKNFKQLLEAIEDDLEAPRQGNSIEPAMRDRIISDFGDRAGGGGDPVDWVMHKYGVSIEQIDDLAQQQGYIDANDWTEDILNLVASYNMEESTDLSRILQLSGINKK